MYFVHTCVLEELYFDILSNFYLLIMHFPCRPLDVQGLKAPAEKADSSTFSVDQGCFLA